MEQKVVVSLLLDTLEKLPNELVILISSYLIPFVSINTDPTNFYSADYIGNYKTNFFNIHDIQCDINFLTCYTPEKTSHKIEFISNTFPDIKLKELQQYNNVFVGNSNHFFTKGEKELEYVGEMHSGVNYAFRSDGKFLVGTICTNPKYALWTPSSVDFSSSMYTNFKTFQERAACSSLSEHIAYHENYIVCVSYEYDLAWFTKDSKFLKKFSTPITYVSALTENGFLVQSMKGLEYFDIENKYSKILSICQYTKVITVWAETKRVLLVIVKLESFDHYFLAIFNSETLCYIDEIYLTNGQIVNVQEYERRLHVHFREQTKPLEILSKN